MWPKLLSHLVLAMVFNKLADAVQVKDKRVLLRYVVRTTISVVFRHVLFIEGLNSMYGTP